MPDKLQKQPESEPLKKEKDNLTPQKPDVDRPEKKDLLERMKRVDPEQAKKYRQRSGQ